MRKLAMAAAITVALTGTAHADYYRGYHHHHYYGGGGGGDWAAPLIGGLIIGGVLGAMRQPRYYDQPPYHLECHWQPIYDGWGNYLGNQRRCYNVPNY